MLNKRYIKSIKRDIFVLISFPVFLFQFLFCYILERKEKKWFRRDITEPRKGHFFSNIYQKGNRNKKNWKGNQNNNIRNPGRDISFPIFIRKEIETRKLERKSKQKISRLIDLLYRLNDIISR